MCNSNDLIYMKAALEAARESLASDDVPVGCVIVKGDRIIGRGFNTRERDGSALGHAEINAIAEACRTLGGWRLSGCTMYVTLEPCTMCAGAIVAAKLDRVVAGAKDPKAGAMGSVISINSYPLNHKPKIEYGLCNGECSSLLTDFFSKKRKEKQKDSK